MRSSALTYQPAVALVGDGAQYRADVDDVASAARLHRTRNSARQDSREYEVKAVARRQRRNELPLLQGEAIVPATFTRRGGA